MNRETLVRAGAAGACRILVVNGDLPPRDRDSGSLRLSEILELLLAAGHHVTLVGRIGIDQEQRAAELTALGIDTFPIDPTRLRARGVPAAGPDLDFDALLAHGRFDLAWLSFFDVAEQYLPLIRARSPLTRIVVDTVDVHHVRLRRKAELSGDAAALAVAEQTRAREQAIYRAADALIAISEEERGELHRLAPEVPTFVVSNVHAVATDAPGFEARRGLLFVGSFPHEPNIDAILNFHRESWPAIRTAVPGIPLTIVGTGPPEAVRALADAEITVTGWVPAVAPYLDAARVSIAPLRYGAGVKGKVGEALSAGLPVVTTPVGAEGMGLLDGEHALIAADPLEFAAKVVRLHEDRELWERLQAAGHAHVDARLGRGAARQAVERVLTGLILPSRAEKLGDERPVSTRPTARRGPRAGILLHAVDDAEALSAQLAALQNAGLDERVEVVLAADPPRPETEALLRRYGNVRVVRGTRPLGRHRAWQLAAQASGAPVVVALAPLALPAPGFLEPLLSSVQDGAALAAPLLDGAAGLRVAPDGSLWPRRADEEGEPDAVALDCVAALRELFSDGLPSFPRGEGHVETQLAAWVSSRGPLTLASDAHVARLSGPPATVVICTRNRALELPDAVALLLASGAQDIVIVDNASTDETSDVAHELAARSGGIVRVVLEPRPGLCHARNAGAEAARHDLLLYLDDDARPAPGWLKHLGRTLARPGVVNAGGPISALWPAERRPGWPGREHEPLLSVLDLGDTERDLVPPDVVYGANWAVRREALRAVGGFDPQFGPGPDARINGDEVSVAWRLHKHGLGRTIYAPGAAIGHRISADRVDDDFLLHRSLCVGVERPRHALAIGEASPDRLMAMAASGARQLCAAGPIVGVASVASALQLIADAPLALAHRIQAAIGLGELAASAVLLGEDEVLLDDLRLTIDRDALLRGVIAA